jgi:flagellar biosynthesis anti-sigma factor FlgM
MEITRNQPQTVGTKHKTAKSATTPSATPSTTSGLSGKTPLDLGGSSSYDVAISPKATNLQKQQDMAYELAKNTSPIREEKVQTLKNKISAGEYASDSNQILEGIVREAVRDQLASEPYPAI